MYDTKWVNILDKKDIDKMKTVPANVVDKDVVKYLMQLVLVN